MKKILSILLVLLSTGLLSSCFHNNDEINQAKQQLGVVEKTTPVDQSKGEVSEKSESNSQQENSQETVTQEETPKEFFTWDYLTTEKFIELDELDFSNLYNGELEITGKTLGNVDKIIVDFKNDSSDFPDDHFTLQKFKSGDATFLYRAFSRYETLDYGENVYVINAYSGEKVSQIEIRLLLEEESDVAEISHEESEENIQTETLFAGDFPILEKFGHPLEIGKNKVSYSDVKGLEIEKIEANLMAEVCNSDEVTTFLTNKLDSWFYWNTCRDISKDKGVSFYTVRIDEENYIYEKHYYLFESGIYGMMSLEQGDGASIEGLPELNKQLKEKNDDFSIIEISDELFEDLVKAF